MGKRKATGTDKGIAAAKPQRAPRRGRPADIRKRAEILAAATAVFLDQGYAAGMDRIARRAGVSKVTVYAHFSSKSMLFGAIIEELAGRLTRGIERLALDNLPPEQALQEVGRAYLTLALAPASLALHRLIVAEAARNPALGRLIFASGPRSIIETLGRYLKSRPELRIGDTALAAEQFLGMVLGHQQLGLLLTARPAAAAQRVIDARVANAVKLFLRGCSLPARTM